MRVRNEDGTWTRVGGAPEEHDPTFTEVVLTRAVLVDAGWAVLCGVLGYVSLVLWMV